MSDFKHAKYNPMKDKITQDLPEWLTSACISWLEMCYGNALASWQVSFLSLLRCINGPFSARSTRRTATSAGGSSPHSDLPLSCLRSQVRPLHARARDSCALAARFQTPSGGTDKRQRHVRGCTSAASVWPHRAASCSLPAFRPSIFPFFLTSFLPSFLCCTAEPAAASRVQL